MNHAMENGLSDWKRKEFFPANILIQKGAIQKQVTISGPEGDSLEVEVASFGEFLISQVTLCLSESTTCICKGHGRTIGLFYNLLGSCVLNGSGQECMITPGQHFIYYSPEYLEQPRLIPENGQMQSLEINVPVSYYTQLLSGDTELQDRFLKKIVADEQQPFQHDMLPMTMPMKWIIHSIRQNRRTGLLKRLFLEAKILELLMLRIEQAQLHDSQIKKTAMKPSERDALYEAKAILEGNLENPPTIKHLARMVGMNEFNLKRGFKDTFQETIYGFVNKIKMQQARQMLLEGNKSVQEVALLSGYKNPQHFTAAFKKYFDILPSKLRE